MRIRWAALLVFGMAMVATLASSVIDGRVIAVHSDIMGCEAGCVTAAGGWPLPYLVDYPGISPVGSVSLSDALLGLDKIRPAALALTFVFWLCASATLVWAAMRRRVTAKAAR